MTDKKNQEAIIAGFNNLRNEQRNLASKQNELQQDLNEHKIVIETLDGVAGDRKCFRMVGGVLVERTVKDVSIRARGGYWIDFVSDPFENLSGDARTGE